MTHRIEQDARRAAASGPPYWSRWITIISWVTIFLAAATALFGIIVAFPEDGPLSWGTIFYSLLIFIIPTCIAWYLLTQVRHGHAAHSEAAATPGLKPLTIILALLLLGFILAVPVITVIQFNTDENAAVDTPD